MAEQEVQPGGQSCRYAEKEEIIVNLKESELLLESNVINKNIPQ